MDGEEKSENPLLRANMFSGDLTRLDLIDDFVRQRISGRRR
jgi:hypothetical protein